MTNKEIVARLQELGIKASVKERKAVLEEKLNKALNTQNTLKEEENMKSTNPVFTPATDRLPEIEEKHTVYGMTEWTAPAPKKEKKMTKTEQKKMETAARKAERATKRAEKEQAKAEKKAMNNAKKESISNLLDFIVDTWEENYGPVVVASYAAKTSFIALKMRDTNRQVIKVVFSSTSIRLAFRIDITEMFEEVKIVNYVMPFQTLIKENSEDVRTRIERAFELAATTDVKKKKKAETKKAEEAKAE